MDSLVRVSCKWERYARQARYYLAFLPSCFIGRRPSWLLLLRLSEKVEFAEDSITTLSAYRKSREVAAVPTGKSDVLHHLSRKKSC